MVQALEDTVVDETVRPYFRVYAWWLLLQCWATLRFSDHRGLVPDEKFEVKGNSLTTRLVRSKTCRGLTELFRQTLRVVVLRLAPSEAARGQPSGLSPAPALRQLQRVCPQGATLRHSACSSDQGLTKFESEGRTVAQSTDCAVLDTSLRTQLLGQRGVSGWSLVTGQGHARRLGGAAKRPLHSCLPKSHHARPEAGGRSPHES